MNYERFTFIYSFLFSQHPDHQIANKNWMQNKIKQKITKDDHMERNDSRLPVHLIFKLKFYYCCVVNIIKENN